MQIFLKTCENSDFAALTHIFSNDYSDSASRIHVFTNHYAHLVSRISILILLDNDSATRIGFIFCGNVDGGGKYGLIQSKLINIASA